jgi:hypothetical protein
MGGKDPCSTYSPRPPGKNLGGGSGNTKNGPMTPVTRTQQSQTHGPESAPDSNMDAD